LKQQFREHLVIIEVRAVAPFYKNGFVVGCERTREAALIDPGDEVDELVGIVRDFELDVRCVLLTHAHVDHVTGVAAARETYDVPVYLHEADLFLYDRVVEQAAMFGFKARQPPPVDRFYDATSIPFGDLEAVVHHTPGHCPGGVCLQIGTAGRPGSHLFVGDTLFAASIGRTDLPGGDYATLMRSITDVLFSLGDASIVHPGHGPDTTIGRERTTNPFVLEYLKGL
jgi:glyoxylase-like metal-dependent hydrolase (beta-lactamase superfamily II)